MVAIGQVNNSDGGVKSHLRQPCSDHLPSYPSKGQTAILLSNWTLVFSKEAVTGYVRWHNAMVCVCMCQVTQRRGVCLYVSGVTMPWCVFVCVRWHNAMVCVCMCQVTHVCTCVRWQGISQWGGKRMNQKARNDDLLRCTVLDVLVSHFSYSYITCYRNHFWNHIATFNFNEML